MNIYKQQESYTIVIFVSGLYIMLIQLKNDGLIQNKTKKIRASAVSTLQGKKERREKGRVALVPCNGGPNSWPPGKIGRDRVAFVLLFCFLNIFYSFLFFVLILKIDLCFIKWIHKYYLFDKPNL